MLRGYLEHADRFSAHGWCFDPEAPTRRPIVELRSGARLLARLTASQFREDLAHIDLGDGRHAFLVTFDPPLAEADLEGLQALAVDGPDPPETLSNLEAAPAAATAPALAFPGLSVDPDARPVFVLGAARSGTTAIAQALLALRGWKGHGEGHMLDILAHWMGVTTRFYGQKHDDTLPESETMLSAVPQSFLQSGLDRSQLGIRTGIFGQRLYHPLIIKIPCDRAGRAQLSLAKQHANIGVSTVDVVGQAFNNDRYAVRRKTLIS